MRFCGGFLARKPLSCPKKGHETGSAPRESVDSALLAIDHADCDSALEAGLTQGVERLDGGSAGGDDVLHEADPLAGLVGAFEAIGGAVLLRLLADDEEGKPRRERRGGRTNSPSRYACSRMAADNSSRFMVEPRAAHLVPAR